jgi:hypothetical protein
MVIEECYFTFVSLQVQNTNNDGWRGAISFSTDGGATYSSMVCVTGCGGIAVSTHDLVVDGNTNVDCSNGRRCFIKPRKYLMHTFVVGIFIRTVLYRML